MSTSSSKDKIREIASDLLHLFPEAHMFSFIIHQRINQMSEIKAQEVLNRVAQRLDK